MYLDFFSLKRHPFRITPDPSLFFHGGTHGRGVVLDALVYGITTGEGILKVVGEVGSGKTMLCRMLEERLPPTVEIVYLANPNLSARDIVYAIAFELKLPVDASTDRLMVMQKLQEYLLGRHAAGANVVVFIEEAQSMPLETLEEVRLLSNLETHRHKLMQIVLFGQPELDRKLENKSIRQLRERITHSFELQPLSEQEIREYLHFRLQAAGCPWPQLFSPKSEKLLAKASTGLSRRINILADKALLAAYADPATRQGMRNSAGEILPMVQPRHMRVAIKDSGYRIDYPGLARNVLLGVVMAALLLIGIGVGWWLNRNEKVQLVSVAVTGSVPAEQEAGNVALNSDSLAAAGNASAAATPLVSAAPIITVSSIPPAPAPTTNAATATPVLQPSAPVTIAPSTPEAVAILDVAENPPPVAALVTEVMIPPGLRGLVAIRARASVSWLASLPSRKGYSVQMYAVGINELDKLQEYFEFLELTNRFNDIYLCRISASGGRKAQWLVLHELFDGYSQAEDYTKKLPPYLAQHQPYVRNVRGIACTN